MLNKPFKIKDMFQKTYTDNRFFVDRYSLSGGSSRLGNLLEGVKSGPGWYYNYCELFFNKLQTLDLNGYLNQEGLNETFPEWLVVGFSITPNFEKVKIETPKEIIIVRFNNVLKVDNLEILSYEIKA